MRNRASPKKSNNKNDGDNSAAGCILIIFISLAVYFIGPWFNSKSKDIKKLEELTNAQSAQIETLKKAQKAFENLFNLIEKEKLDAESRALNLKSEIERLQQLQKVDQKTVDEIFYEQQKQNRRERWIEWGAAWAIGILSAIFFDLIFKKPLRRLFAKRNTDI